MGASIGAFLFFITTAVSMFYIPPAAYPVFVLVQFVGAASFAEPCDTTKTDNKQLVVVQDEEQE